MPPPDAPRNVSRPNAGGRDVMDDFLNRIGQVDLLTSEQERSLGAEVRAAAVAREALEHDPTDDTAARRALQRRLLDLRRSRPRGRGGRERR